MKKIFAFVLASLMVLSLVPASAFAITKCPAVHTSTNCDSTELRTVPATCENAGYTEYVCNTCGVKFLDNLKPKAKHTWVSNPKLAAGNLAASCVYQTTGKEALICAVCDEKYDEDGYKETDWNAISVHNLEKVSGVGCEELWACTLCGAKGYIGKNAANEKVLTEEPGHNYEFVEVKSAPYYSKGTAYTGTAIFACETCGATKEVVIDTPACTNEAHASTHKEATIVQTAKDATCSAKGAYLVVKCEDCNKTWYCSAKNCASTHKKDTDHTWASLKDNKTSNLPKHDALGHIDSNGWRNGATSSASTHVCGRSYYCTRCYTWQTVGHDYNGATKHYMVEANCTVKAQWWRQCNDCKAYATGTDNATKHSNSDKGTTKIIPATCSTPAMKIVYCTNGDCPLTRTLINGTAYALIKAVEYIGNVNADAHTWLGDSDVTTLPNSNPDVYCSTASYVYKICANGCAEYGSGKLELVQPEMHDFFAFATVHNFSKAVVVDGALLNPYTTRSWVMCKKCGRVPTAVPYVDTADATVKTTFNSVEEALEYHGVLKTYWTLDKDGKVVVDITKGIKGYEGRDAYAGMTVDAIKALVFGEPVPYLSTPASCTTPATEVYVCKDCNTYVWVQGEKIGHTPSKYKAGTKASCIKEGVHDTYECAKCGVTYWIAGGKEYTTSPVKYPCSDTVVKKTDLCGGENTEYWKCTVCNTCYTDATCAEKYVPAGHAFELLLAGAAATCNTTGLPEIRYCAECGVLEINVIYMIAGEEVRVNFNETGIKFTEGAVAVAIGTDFLSEAVIVNVSAEGDVSFTYANDNWIEWPAAVSVKKMESETSHRALYNAVSGELASGIVAASTVVWQDSQEAIPVAFESIDHTKPSFTLYYCEACVYEFVADFIPAQGGHVNSKGNLITEDCNDGAKGDRICVVCYNYYAALETYVGEYADKYTIGAHEWVDSAESTYTCSTAGYEAKVCTKCGEYQIVGESYVPANADKYHKSLKTKINKYIAQDEAWMVARYLRGNYADYATDGYHYYACDVCEEVLIAGQKTACPGKGLEINMSTEYDSYIPNSYIELVISLDSLKGVNAWGLSFSVGYNPELVQFVGADFSASPFALNKANELIGKAYSRVEDTSRLGYHYEAGTKTIPYGVVSLVSNSNAGVELVGENAYAVLTFKVTQGMGQAMFEIGNIIPLAAQADPQHPAYALYTTNVVGPNNTKIAVNYNTSVKEVGWNEYVVSNKTLTVSTEAFLDFDGDREYTIFDAFELYYLIENDEYSVLADADHDNDVDTDDLDILYSLIVGEKTVEDILKGEEEEQDRVITYDEEGFVIYDSKYDFNNDGILSAYEIAVMTGRIDPDLNPGTN